MNAAMLRRMHTSYVRIRPVVQRRLAPDAPFLRPTDGEWWIDARSMAPGAVVRLHHPPTGHFVDVYSDSIQEFRQPDQLILKEQLTLTPRGVLREALPDRRMAYKISERRHLPDEDS